MSNPIFLFLAFGKFPNNLSIDTLVGNSLPIPLEIRINHENNQITSYSIVENSIVKHKRKINLSSDQQTIVIKFRTDETAKEVEAIFQIFKTNNPDIKTSFEHKNTAKNNSNEKLHYQNHCRSISESIASMVTYSLNTNFRKECMNLLNTTQCSTMSVQEIIKFKLENLERTQNADDGQQGQ